MMQKFYEVNDNDLNDVTGGFIKSEQYDENGYPYISEDRMCPAWCCTCGCSSFSRHTGVSTCVVCSNLLKCGNCSKYIKEKGVCSDINNRKN